MRLRENEMKIFYTLLFVSLTLIAKEASVKQLFNVQTVKVKKIDAAKNRKYYGYVAADESKIYDVTPRFSGYVEHLKADKLYEHVTKGELLAEVYSPEVLRAKEEYLNTLEYVKKIPNEAMLASAKEKLLLLGVDPREIKNIETTHKVSRANGIYAPQSGYIFAKAVVEGSGFTARTRLFEIVDLSAVWVETAIYPKDLSLLMNLTRFKVDSPVGAFEAQKEILYPKVEKKDAPLTLRLKVNNKDDSLAVGMYVSITASSAQKSYLVLPATAVIFKNGSYYVFKAGDYEGEYDPVALHVKELDSKTYIVQDTLKEGDEVVNNALFMIDSDAQINGLY